MTKRPSEDGRVASVLAAEAAWLRRAHANSHNKGYSEQFREGFNVAAGWVQFHAEAAARGNHHDHH